MEAINELRDLYRKMSFTLDDIEAKVYALKHPDENFMNNEEFLKRMNVSKRTAQMWRENELIDYSKVGNQFYYSTADITNFLKNIMLKRDLNVLNSVQSTDQAYIKHG